MSTAVTDIPALPEVSERVRDLASRMTLEEKLAQLVGFWVDQGGEVVAPMQGEMTAAGGGAATVRDHPGRDRPPHPRLRHPSGRRRRARGVAVGRAASAAARDPARHPRDRARGVPDRARGVEGRDLPDPARLGRLVRPRSSSSEIGAAVGASMRALGIHQGLAPVLDVIRDPRWGRVDECIAEDPYVVGTIGTAYVQGLQRAGVHATLKHFVGYSGSRGRAQPRPRARRSARDRRRVPAAVRDGDSATAGRGR